MQNKLCVYTVLIGEYEQLNEQPVRENSTVEFICFSDNKDLKSQTWNIRPITPVFPLDLARSSRLVKICPHRFLGEFDISLYIDNSVVLKKTPEEICSALLVDEEIEMVSFKHSFRETVLDEFIAVIQGQLDNLNTILEQLNAYSLVDPEVLSEKPYKNNFILRKHNRPHVIQVMEKWLAHVLRYSRRDQLSLNYCMKNSHIQLHSPSNDALRSEYFHWPVTTGRDEIRRRETAMFSTVSNYLAVNSPASRLRNMEQLLHTLNSQLSEQQRTIETLRVRASQLDEIHRSRAWKWVDRMRNIRRLLFHPFARKSR